MTAPNINTILCSRPRKCTYGAPMGSSGWDDSPGYVKRYCQRIKFVDGDYAPDGTYWGGGRDVLPLYAVFTADMETIRYFRAPSRAAALCQYLNSRAIAA